MNMQHAEMISPRLRIHIVTYLKIFSKSQTAMNFRTLHNLRNQIRCDAL